MNSDLFYLLLITFCLKAISAKECQKSKTCGECIGNPNDCVWCPDHIFIGPRCQSKLVKMNTTWCKYIYDPVIENPTKLIRVNDLPLKSADRENTDNIQIRPQMISIKARPGVPVDFKMFYKPAKDYPLDVYYLIDNSYTMKFQKDKLRDQARAIHDRLVKITNNVQFGVGSYIEKPGLPYASLKNDQSYSFKNHLSITDDIDLFSKVVNETSPSGNFDSPENALDGLMQAMACEEEIKWRPDARRIIVLSTDSPYHSAGDGKIVGAIKPNDMRCHLKNNTYAEESLIYDYPSVSQINKIAYEKRVTILFAALNSMKEVYEALAKTIRESEYVELSPKSDIPNIIEKIYMSQVQKLKISKENLPQNVKLVLDPPCSEEIPQNFKVGETVEIKGVLTVTECAKREKITNFSIGPTKLKEVLDIQLQVMCDCDCEKEGKIERNSNDCHNLGTYQCGICKCNNGSYGETCECKGVSTRELDLIKCGENNFRKACSGRGVCRCGKCECVQNYHEPYCEFSIKDCQFHDGEPCGGHGRCIPNNQTCVCDNGWSGTACACNDIACIGPNSKICSGHGQCNCGKCECTKDVNNKKYIGKYCNFCEGCTEERCSELGNFVECYHKTKGLCNEFKLRSIYEVYMMNQTEINRKVNKTNQCRRIQEDGSFIVFGYEDTAEKTIIVIQEEKQMPPEPDIWVAVGSAIGTILLIGILTVIVWKVLVDYYDKKEYERFLKQSTDEGYDISKLSQNPIYQPPSTTISNPAYQG